MNEKDIEEIIIKLKKDNKFNIVKWEPNKIEYPLYMLLSGDKGILAYINFYRLDKENKYNHNYYKLLKKISLSYSDLDRPVFNIYCDSHNEMFFETYEQIKDMIYNNIYGDGLFIAKRKDMGNREELLSKFSDLKINNVKFS